MRNINSHKAYQELRDIRQSLRAQGQKLTGSRLAQGLGYYSERGNLYVKELIAMIKQNQLE